MKGILNALLKTAVGKMLLTQLLNLFKAWLLSMAFKKKKDSLFLNSLEDFLIRLPVEEFIKEKDNPVTSSELTAVATIMERRSQDHNNAYA